MPLQPILPFLVLATLLQSGACVYRPLPPRISVDELIQESLDRSNAVNSGDEHYVQPILEDELIVDNGHWENGAWVESNVVPTDAPYGSGLIDTALDPHVASIDDSIRINEEFIETDVREVLMMLTTEANLDLVMDDNVGGIVNAQINDLLVDEAIEKVLMPLGLSHTRRGDQVIVAPPDPSSPLFSYISVRKDYRPLHIDSRALMETVPASWLQYVTSIESAKLLMVHAPPRITDDIISRFASIDQPIPQVVLEAIICVVSPDCGFQFGLDWQHAVELDGAKSLALGATGLALNGTVSSEGMNQIFSEFSSTSTFVKLLNEHGYLTIRASPHVMAKDGEQANIAINRETFFSVQPPGTTGNNAVFFQQDIQKVDAGITLDITPHIRGDVVTIDIEKAEVSEDVRTANNELSVNPFPVINRRSVSTTVSVKDGKTIVIGGLVQRETIDRVNRVPGLSRLPGVGYLFQSTQRQTRDAEVVIFISPRIVRSEGS
ncbi:type II secretory pathway component GspD/PulD (secretin) [Rhodopirellula rubra]|uniref:Type II secretory pathway component GspD/PulD (Secretin) n=1 Tax=Aporhodopirellula rubra TaxID=980271 RepID=A0A7W5E4G7_9BACT|nr:type II and III secretion system protein [Aporhodopirellula rubra]MBB3210016.1 type II secretory pathway component GspD/PulD (secretin) [Aporhodopirellula rubra]